MDDNLIVELFFGRDERAIREAENKYSAYLRKVAYNILGSDEDVSECVNDTYLAAWNSIPPHKPTNLLTYLSKLVRRSAVDIYRSRTRQKRRGSEYSASLSELSEVLPSGDSPDDALNAKLLTKTIEDFLKGVTDESRKVFVARYYFLDSVSDISKYFGISTGKVKTILHRTRRKLREHLEREGFPV